MSSINKVTLIGNVGNDPEIRGEGDNRVCVFSLATSESWKDKATGEKRERTEWHRIKVFTGGLIDVIEKHVKKGSKLYIQGMLRTQKWQDNDGNDQYTTEIEIPPYGGEFLMLDGK